jgi:hypothetical protein
MVITPVNYSLAAVRPFSQAAASSDFRQLASSSAPETLLRLACILPLVRLTIRLRTGSRATGQLLRRRDRRLPALSRVGVRPSSLLQLAAVACLRAQTVATDLARGRGRPPLSLVLLLIRRSLLTFPSLALASAGGTATPSRPPRSTRPRRSRPEPALPSVAPPPLFISPRCSRLPAWRTIFRARIGARRTPVAQSWLSDLALPHPTDVLFNKRTIQGQQCSASERACGSLRVTAAAVRQAGRWVGAGWPMDWGRLADDRDGSSAFCTSSVASGPRRRCFRPGQERVVCVRACRAGR